MPGRTTDDALTDSRGPLEPWMCGAKLHGKGGLKCRRRKLAGARHCALHGSATSAAREKAKERILLASNLAAKRLIEFMNSEAVPYRTRLAAARDLLDRADLAGVSTLEVELPFMQTINRAIQ